MGAILRVLSIKNKFQCQMTTHRPGNCCLRLWGLSSEYKDVLGCEGNPLEHTEEISGDDDYSLARKLTPRRTYPLT